MIEKIDLGERIDFELLEEIRLVDKFHGVHRRCIVFQEWQVDAVRQQWEYLLQTLEHQQSGIICRAIHVLGAN